MDALIHATPGTRWKPSFANHQPPPCGWHFSSSLRTIRIRRNSLKMKDGASVYPSQNPEGAILTGPLDNAESVHIRYSFALLP